MKKLNPIIISGILLLAFVSHFPANAANIRTTILGNGPIWTPIRVIGTITEAELSRTVSVSSVGSTRLMFSLRAYRNGAFVWSGQEEILEGGMALSSCSPDTKAKAVQIINQYLSRGVTLGERYGTALDVDFDKITFDVQITCRSGGSFTPGTQYNLGQDIDTEIINPPIPPTPVSVCTLSNNVNLNYSSSTLNVAGLSQSSSVGVSCTSGTASNYRLSLTSSNVSNGRLAFPNGVTAQVYLNGSAVSANGSGINLNSLTSRNIPVRADLFGTAANSGITTANGVLVLNAY